jgi:hypothetical protein
LSAVRLIILGSIRPVIIGHGEVRPQSEMRLPILVFFHKC